MSMGFKGRRRYKNSRTFVDDQWFDSKWESECWLELKEIEEEGIIYDLSRHKDECLFYFKHNGIIIARARLDFSFSIEGIERRVIADAKSPATIDFQRFRWQKNMMLAFYDLPVVTFLQGQDHVWQIVMQIKERGLDDYLIPEQVR